MGRKGKEGGLRGKGNNSNGFKGRNWEKGKENRRKRTRKRRGIVLVRKGSRRDKTEGSLRGRKEKGRARCEVRYEGRVRKGKVWVGT